MDKLFLSSLRGVMGDWVYYPCLVPLSEVAQRVGFAEELYENPSMSDLLQRTIKRGRSKEIKDYLLTQDQHFFNSIIVAVYGGEPAWYPVAAIQGSEELDINEVPEEVVESIGILQLNGSETLFALDGQHRLAGIKQAIETDDKLGTEDLSVIFISHNKTSEGKERSRRLFTTLNKHSKKVSKAEVIALDEDDTMAITVRRLVREYDLFMGRKIASSHTDNMPKSNCWSITTLGNLYDILLLLYLSGSNERVTLKKHLITNRLDDETLDNYFTEATSFFDDLAGISPALKSYKDASDSDLEKTLGTLRNADGGNVLFRPIGLKVVTELFSRLRSTYSYDDAISKISSIPVNLTDRPYKGVLWKHVQKRMNHKGRQLCVRLLLYMLGEPIDEASLRNDYAKELELDPTSVNLPEKII